MVNAEYKDLRKNKELAARMMAVQACYEVLHSKRPVSDVVQEYTERGLQLDFGQNDAIKSDSGLFKRIMAAVNSRHAEIEDILLVSVQKEDDEKKSEKEIEALLRSILMCGIAEVLCHQDIDRALIINDYLDVTHAFYEKGQVSFVNGVLDKVAKVLSE